MAVVLRRAVPSDGPQIADLIRAWAPHFGVKGYPAGVWPEGMVVRVAAESRRVVGWIEGVLDEAHPVAPAPPPHGYLLAVIVDPGWRRHGVGRSLVDAFLSDAHAAGVRWVYLMPDQAEGAEDPARFFVRCGFTHVDDPDEEHPVMARWVHPPA